MRHAVLGVILGLSLFGADAMAACSGPEGVEGQIIYNRKWKVMQFCDDTRWIGMGSANTGVGAAGAAGEIQFSNGSGNLAADSSLFWDNTNKRLSVGTDTPQSATINVVTPATSGYVFGVFSQADSTSAHAIYGHATASTGSTYGVYGQADSPDGYGVYSNGRMYSTGALTVENRVSADSFFQLSDRNLKKNIEDIADPFVLLHSVTGKHFRWKKDDKPAYGVIAQDVESTMPEAVGTNDEGLKIVEYSQLIAPLIEAVKILKADNENLRAEINALKEGVR